MAEGIHLFPYRTQKLSPHASKVLGWQRPGRIDHRRILIFLSSSMAEHSAVNRRVVSSSLTWGAFKTPVLRRLYLFWQCRNAVACNMLQPTAPTYSLAQNTQKTAAVCSAAVSVHWQGITHTTSLAKLEITANGICKPCHNAHYTKRILKHRPCAIQKKLKRCVMPNCCDFVTGLDRAKCLAAVLFLCIIIGTSVHK